MHYSKVYNNNKFHFPLIFILHELWLNQRHELMKEKPWLISWSSLFLETKMTVWVVSTNLCNVYVFKKCSICLVWTRIYSRQNKDTMNGYGLISKLSVYRWWVHLHTAQKTTNVWQMNFFICFSLQVCGLDIFLAN